MPTRILGIESSCDDAASAVIETTAPGIAEIRSSTVANQDDIHRAYGGIVPELASRNHVVTIAPVIERAGPAVEVVTVYDGRPVLVRQGAIWGSTFHPELSGDLRLHYRFLRELGS